VWSSDPGRRFSRSSNPELGYVFKVNGQAAYLNLRGYKEFGAQNRLEGYALFATVSIPLGSRQGAKVSKPASEYPHDVLRRMTWPIHAGDEVAQLVVTIGRLRYW
jgi:hypothetical protein